MSRDSYDVKGLRECLCNHTAGSRTLFDKGNQKRAVASFRAHDLYVMAAGWFFAEENRDNYFFAEIYGREWWGIWFD